MTIEFRRPAPEELRDAGRTVASALLFPPLDDEAWAKSRPTWEEMVSVAAFDAGRCVGFVGQFLVDTTVPGGARLATGAVSRVGVLSTHRRRRVATELMQRLIAESVERRLPLMSLRASEAVIYPRYGFGLAGEFVEATIDPTRTLPVRGATTEGTFRQLRGAEIHTTIHDVYDRFAHTRPGVITRPDSFWERYFRTAAEETKGSYVVVHVADDGSIDGFAHYDVAWNETEGASGGKGEISDVVGATPSVELGLWAYLFEIDLIRTWTVSERPVDDLVREAIADRRAYAVKSVNDEQWVRLIDVGAALEARTYNDGSGSVTIEVTDPLITTNNGRWRVSASGAVATDDDADLAVDIATLSAAYFGGTGWHTLAAIGAVDQRTPGSVTTADVLFASRPQPYCGSFF